MNCIILFRLNGGPVRAVFDFEAAEIQEFPHMDDAVTYATGENPFAKLVESGQADYQIVELNEL